MAETPTGASEPGLARYVEAVASAAPTPGGGSVAAVVGALAAALGAMVANLTVGKSADTAVETELANLLVRLADARRRFLDLASDDERAYGGYLAAAALPRKPDEKAVRAAAMQAALAQSAAVPLSVATAGLELLPHLRHLAEIGNSHVLSDAEVAAILVDAAVRAALVNVRVNARLIRDPALREELHRQSAAIETAAATGAASVRQTVAQRTV